MGSKRGLWEWETLEYWGVWALASGNVRSPRVGVTPEREAVGMCSPVEECRRK